MLPVSIEFELAVHLERVRAQHERDLVSGAGWVELPGALAKKIPSAARELALAVDLPRHAALHRA